MTSISPLLAIVVLLAGCAGATADGLAGRTFISTAVTDAAGPRALVPGTQIRLTFADDGTLGVNAGCNAMGATYTVDGAVLRIEGGAMTEMGCDPERHAQDDWVFAFLGSGPTVTLAGNDLTLAAGSTSIRFVDREFAEPDQPLVGPTWTVVSIVAGDAVSSIPDGVVATLRFAPDGRVEVASGCNQGGGRYAVDGAALRFFDVALTEMACSGAAGEMDAAVIAVLRSDAVSQAIEASTLTLDAGGRGLVLQAP